MLKLGLENIKNKKQEEEVNNIIEINENKTETIDELIFPKKNHSENFLSKKIARKNLDIEREIKKMKIDPLEETFIERDQSFKIIKDEKLIDVNLMNHNNQTSLANVFIIKLETFYFP